MSGYNSITQTPFPSVVAQVQPGKGFGIPLGETQALDNPRLVSIKIRIFFQAGVKDFEI